MFSKICGDITGSVSSSVDTQLWTLSKALNLSGPYFLLLQNELAGLADFEGPF